jgi:hypothetical protein
MEEMVAAPVQDGQQPKSPTEVVSNVLLSSIVFRPTQSWSPVCLQEKLHNPTITAKVQQLQNQLYAEKQEKNGLREEAETIDSIKR